jgi:hypothetical protein
LLLLVILRLVMLLLLLLLLVILLLVLLLLGLIIATAFSMVTPAIPSQVPLRLRRKRLRDVDTTTTQLDINTTLVLLSRVVETQLLAEMLDPRLQLLHTAGRVVPLADNDMQMGLAGGLEVADAGFEDVLCLLDKLAVQVNGVFGDAAWRVVLAEDELGGLLVVVGLFLLMALAFV